MPIIYRVWTAVRGKLVKAWMRGAGIRGLIEAPGGTMEGAEEQGLLLSLMLEESVATGEPVAGLALDWSKCYDQFGHNQLQEILVAAEFPPALGAPMMAMYCSPRRLRLDGALGQWGIPCRGIPPGCRGIP